MSYFKRQSVMSRLMVISFIQAISVNWGKGDQNPVACVHFYSKDNNFVKNGVEQLKISVMLPKSYEEMQIHVLSCRSDAFALNIIRWCYDMYWKHSTGGHQLLSNFNI